MPTVAGRVVVGGGADGDVDGDVVVGVADVAGALSVGSAVGSAVSVGKAAVDRPDEFGALGVVSPEDAVVSGVPVVHALIRARAAPAAAIPAAPRLRRLTRFGRSGRKLGSRVVWGWW
jgi:hypothetical protein